jgi:hypothetical protein
MIPNNNPYNININVNGQIINKDNNYISSSKNFQHLPDIKLTRPFDYSPINPLKMANFTL